MNEMERRFIYWIKERESIRKMRLAGRKKPWTDDKILQSYRFCNVRRMDDRVSKWLLHNWYRPYFDHPNMLIACALARHFNQPKTLETIGFPKRWDSRSALRKVNRLGGPIFNSAYMVTGAGGWNKAECVITRRVHQFYEDPVELNSSSMEESVRILSARKWIGSFMAGQIVADLRWAVTGSWEDKDSWAAVGNGSSRGLCRLLGRPAVSNMSQKEFNIKFPPIMEWLRKELPTHISSRLEAIDYQSCLCEVDKYERALHGQGRPKQRYPGI